MTYHYLSQARDALTRGQATRGHMLAQHALMRSVKARDKRAEAQAFLVLGQGYVLESRLQLARDVSSHAHELFRGQGDVAGQAEALAIRSLAASMTGNNEEAMQAANDSIALHGPSAPAPACALGYNYLGVATTWARDFAGAVQAFETSIWLAGSPSGQSDAGFHPWVNLCFTEVLRIVDLERAGRSPDLSKLRRMVLRARAIASTGETAMLRPGLATDSGLLLLDFASCFSACRSGLLDEAFEHFVACRDRSSRLPQGSWGQALVWWLRLELARIHGNSELSHRSAHAMGLFARRGEHAQLHSLARSLEADLMVQLLT